MNPALAFVELALPRPERSVLFLEQVLKIRFEAISSHYWLTTHHATRLGLFYGKPFDNALLPYLQQQALVFFEIQKIDKASITDRAHKAGGQLAAPWVRLPGIGEYAQLQDCEAIRWGVFCSPTTSGNSEQT